MAISPTLCIFIQIRKNQHILNFLSIGIISSNRLFSGIAFVNCDVVAISAFLPFTCSACCLIYCLKLRISFGLQLVQQSFPLKQPQYQVFVHLAKILIHTSFTSISQWIACASLCGWRYIPPIWTFTDQLNDMPVALKNGDYQYDDPHFVYISQV